VSALVHDHRPATLRVSVEGQPLACRAAIAEAFLQSAGSSFGRQGQSLTVRIDDPPESDVATLLAADALARTRTNHVRVRLDPPDDDGERVALRLMGAVHDRRRYDFFLRGLRVERPPKGSVRVRVFVFGLMREDAAPANGEEA